MRGICIRLKRRSHGPDLALLMTLQSFATHGKHNGVQQPSRKRQEADVPAKRKGSRKKVEGVMASEEHGWPKQTKDC